VPQRPWMAERGRRAACSGNQPGRRHATRPVNLLDIMTPAQTCSELPWRKKRWGEHSPELHTYGLNSIQAEPDEYPRPGRNAARKRLIMQRTMLADFAAQLSCASRLARSDDKPSRSSRSRPLPR